MKCAGPYLRAMTTRVCAVNLNQHATGCCYRKIITLLNIFSGAALGGGPLPAGHLVRRALRRLQQAFALVAPRVGIVLFRTWLNGRPTSRRFQDRSKCCLLRCGRPTAEDSIEHYAFCPVVLEVARCHVNLPDHTIGSVRSFLVLYENVSKETLTLQLLLLYAVYGATNAMRYGKEAHRLHPLNCQQLILQLIWQGVFGHTPSLETLRDATGKRRVRAQR